MSSNIRETYVTHFQKAMGQPMNAELNVDLLQLRMDLIKEEVRELDAEVGAISYQLIKSLLDNGVKNILINSRAAKVEAKKELIKKGLKITNLINEQDDRQFVISNKQYKIKKLKPLFPNVPFVN